MLRPTNDSASNVAWIVLGALAFGLAAGLPLGYAARLYAESPSANLAWVQNE